MTSSHHIGGVAHRDRHTERDRWAPALGAGMVLGALSTIGLVIAMFLSWQSTDIHPSDIPFAFLFDDTTTSNDPSILIALIPMAVLLGVGTVMPRARAARIVGALGTIAVVVLFAVQLNDLTDKFPGSDLGDVLDPGFYVAAVAGIVGLVSGFMPSGWARRRTMDTDSDVRDRRRDVD